MRRSHLFHTGATGVRRAARALAAALLVSTAATALSTIAAVPSAHAADAPAGFYDGLVAYSNVVNCISIIQSNPYSEKGAAAWVGYYAAPSATPSIPQAGAPFYVHLEVMGMGNSCAGMRFLPGLELPAGLTLDKRYPILCFGGGVQQTQGGPSCPQWDHLIEPNVYANGFAYKSTDTANASLWPLPQGAHWEFRFPVVASTTMANATMVGHIRMFDGNSSPLLSPTQGVYVFGAASAPAVFYDQPSTRISRLLPPELFGPNFPSGFGVYSEGQIRTSVAGYAMMRIRRQGQAYDPDYAVVPMSAGTNRVVTDWDETYLDDLVPGVRYEWQLGFDPGTYEKDSADDVWGALQTFVRPTITQCSGLDVTVSLEMGQLPTDGNDVIAGTPLADSIAAGAGNDTVCSGDGNDTVSGGMGDDTLFGGPGNDTLSYADAASGVTASINTTSPVATGGAGTDETSEFENLSGSSFGDTLTGGPGNNIVSGLAGNDTLYAAADGTDQLDGGAGGDVLDGGAATGAVFATYRTAPGPVTVSLLTTVAQNTIGAGTDTIRSVRNLIGSPFNDTLTGNNLINRINGGDGNDTIRGLIGNDTVESGNGNDTIAGGDGNDILVGGVGNDTFDGGAGNDVMNGGTGVNAVTYTSATAAVRVNLATTVAQATGGSGSDRLLSIVNLTGSRYNDTLAGTAGVNTIRGWLGNDVVNGAGGNDVVDGGDGLDKVYGGDGNDSLLGGNHNDALNGGNGTDRCDGGAGTDTRALCETILGFP